MFKEFNVEFQDVEMIGGADNLLENTKVTKVVMSGDNKMSSLDSAFKNCSELDNIQGGLDLNGVSDVDSLLEGTNLVTSIDLKNINNENISANNSFPNVEEINIGGELYNKKAIQNVIASKEWTFDNFNYTNNVGDNIVTKEVNVIDDNQITIKDTLEQKVRGIEIIGETFDGVETAGILQEDGSYRIEISTNNGGTHNQFLYDSVLSETGAITRNGSELKVVNFGNASLVNIYLNCKHLKPNTDYNISFKFKDVSDGFNITQFEIVSRIDYFKQFLNVFECVLNTGNFSGNGNLVFACRGNTGAKHSVTFYDFSILEVGKPSLKSIEMDIISDSPLTKDDKLYWNDTNKRYEIDRNGVIEVPTVEGDIIDLPRLYQREDTVLTVECGNIKPSEIKIEYKDLN